MLLFSYSRGCMGASPAIVLVLWWIFLSQIAFVTLLAVAAIIDARRRRIPNKINLVILVLGLTNQLVALTWPEIFGEQATSLALWELSENFFEKTAEGGLLAAGDRMAVAGSRLSTMAGSGNPSLAVAGSELSTTVGSGIPSLGLAGLGLAVMAVPMAFSNLARPGSFGGGDIKMTAACGFYLGADKALQGTMVAFILAGLFGAFLLLARQKERKESFPLGPFLAVGYVATLL